MFFYFLEISNKFYQDFLIFFLLKFFFSYLLLLYFKVCHHGLQGRRSTIREFNQSFLAESWVAIASLTLIWPSSKIYHQNWYLNASSKVSLWGHHWNRKTTRNRSLSSDFRFDQSDESYSPKRPEVRMDWKKENDKLIIIFCPRRSVYVEDYNIALIV